LECNIQEVADMLSETMDLFLHTHLTLTRQKYVGDKNVSKNTYKRKLSTKFMVSVSF